LTKAGVKLFDRELLRCSCQVLQGLVQPATAGGVLDALGAAVAGEKTEANGQGQLRAAAAPAGVAAAGTALAQGFASWTPAERRQLRGYLLQQRWFDHGPDGQGGLTQPQLRMLLQLPIFETHAATAVDRVKGTSLGQQGDGYLEHLGANFVSLSGTSSQVGQHPGQSQSQPQELLLAPKGMPPQLLGCSYLRCDSEEQEQLLQNHLGLARQNLSAFLLDHVAVAADQLDQAAVVMVVAGMMGRLQQLQQEEPGIADILG
jgi:hypothetical protein